MRCLRHPLRCPTDYGRKDFFFTVECGDFLVSLTVQVPDDHILTQNLYQNYNDPKPMCLIIGYLDPIPTPYIPLHIPIKGHVITLNPKP